MATIDYTTARVGTKTPSGKIVVCPRCGRKGARRDYPNPQPPSKMIACVSHKGHIEYGFRTITDHCFLTTEDDH